MGTELYAYETALHEEGVSCICGIDEAGRGPLAGPVCAAACILPAGLELPGLNDSKKLTEKRREALYTQIIAQAVAWAVCLVDEKTIDEINILQATFRAMRGAVEQLSVRPDGTIYDGRKFGSWTLDNAAITFTHDDYRLSLVKDHLEHVTDSGVRLIYAHRGEEARFRSVFMRELLESEKRAAETEPLVGFWVPDGVEEKGELLPRSSRTESILSSLHRLWIRSDGSVHISGREAGHWQNTGGVYAIEFREGTRTPRVTFDGTRLAREFSDTLTIIYKKEPFRN